MKLDLHIHSKYSSDGDYSVKTLFKMAKDAGVDVIAIVDHNTTDALDEAIKIKDRYGLEFVPGVELSTRYEELNIHILGYFISWKDKYFKKQIEILKNNTIELTKKRIKKIRTLGYKVTFKQVISIANRIPSMGPTIAKAILENPNNESDIRLYPYLYGAKSDKPSYNFYRDYFKKNKPAYVPYEEYNSLQAIKTIKKTGGVPVLAHPAISLNPISEEKVIHKFRKNGLQGLEVYTSHHNEDEIKKYRKIAKKHNLIIFAGSDFHGPSSKPHIKLGKIFIKKVDSKALQKFILSRLTND